MKIAMVASESNPFCKTGGLADVVYSLSKELVNLGDEVCVILPFYRSVKERFLKRWGDLERVGEFDVFLSWRRQNAEIYLTKLNGISFYFIRNEYYFNRDSLYGFGDDGERFAFFSLAARQVFGLINLHPDVIHVHDWQSAMLPVLIKEQNATSPEFQGTRFVLTLHNEAFKGLLDKYFLNNFFGLDDRIFDNGAVEYNGQVSTLKAGIMYADKVVAVSPNHAVELMRKDDSLGLCGVLEIVKGKFSGIVNGVDQDEFNPEKDPRIIKNYGLKSIEGKRECKRKLLEDLGLDDTDGPVFGLVSRLTYQKGMNLIFPLIDDLMKREDVRVTILGSGEAELERICENLHAKYPKRFGIYRGYSDQLAHEIYAGSDFFFMPSLFEPCGIGQMIAERYGSLPIVRNVGGLTDTVVNYGEKNANGFVFDDFTTAALKGQVELALKVYDDKPTLKKMRENAMKADHSWLSSAKEYQKLYK